MSHCRIAANFLTPCAGIWTLSVFLIENHILSIRVSHSAWSPLLIVELRGTDWGLFTQLNDRTVSTWQLKNTIPLLYPSQVDPFQTGDWYDNFITHFSWIYKNFYSILQTYTCTYNYIIFLEAWEIFEIFIKN